MQLLVTYWQVIHLAYTFPHPESNDSFKNLQILGFLVNGNFIQNH